MKIPIIPFYKIERAERMLPIIKDVFTPTSTESGSNSQIRKLEDALTDKKAEICKLREKIIDLEENLKNCSYELNILNNAINNSGG